MHQEDTQLIGALRGSTGLDASNNDYMKMVNINTATRPKEGQSSYYATATHAPPSLVLAERSTNLPADTSYNHMQSNLQNLQDKIKDLENKLSGAAGNTSQVLRDRSPKRSILKPSTAGVLSGNPS